MKYHTQFKIYHEWDSSVGIPGESLLVRLPDLSHQMSPNDAAEHQSYLLEILRTAAQEAWSFPAKINPSPVMPSITGSVYDQFWDLYKQPGDDIGSPK